MRPLYRLRQAWRGVWARPLPPPLCHHIANHLSPAQMALFGRFTPRDQWHSYGVWRTLCQAGHTHPDLLTAALLHDVGKSRIPRFGLIPRTWATLASKLWPTRAAVWGQRPWAQARPWQKPLVVYTQHPQWSYELATEVDTSPLALALIRRHQEPLAAPRTEEEHLLALLQWADDQN